MDTNDALFKDDGVYIDENGRAVLTEEGVFVDVSNNKVYISYKDDNGLLVTVEVVE